MSDAGDGDEIKVDEAPEVEVAADAPAPKGKMTVEDALQVYSSFDNIHLTCSLARSKC
jgi:hypothetical protein